MSLLDDDDKKAGLTVFHGGKDRTSARQMQDSINDPMSFRTVMRYFQDRVEMLRTKGGMPQWSVTQIDSKVEAYRGFVAHPTSFYFGGTAYFYNTRKPSLLKYSSSKWGVRRSNYPLGHPTGYFIVDSAFRIPAAPLSDLHFYDVAMYGAESGSNVLRVSYTEGNTVKTKALKQTFSSGSLPILLLPSAGDDRYPSLASDDGTDYHVFPVDLNSVSHIAGRLTASDSAYSVSDANTARLPVVSSSVGATVGYSDVNKAITFFGVNATFTGANSDYQNLYHWYSEIQIGGASPYLTAQSETPTPAPIREYSRNVDLSTGATLTSNSYPTVGEYAGSPQSMVSYDIYPVAWTASQILPGGSVVWSGVETFGGSLVGVPSLSGSHDDQVFHNSVSPFNDDYTVGSPIGPVTMHHDCSVLVDYLRRASYTSFGTEVSTVGYNGTGDSGATWVGRTDNYPPDIIAGEGSGGSTVKRTTCSNQTTVSYRIESIGIDLFTLSAALDYTDYVYETTTFSNYDIAGRSVDRGVSTTTTSSLSVVPHRTWIRGLYLEGYATKHFDNSAGETYQMVSSADVVVRDYLYHDIHNDVSICLKGVGHGANNAPMVGKSSWSITLEVVARGVAHSISLFSSTGAGHNLGHVTEDHILGATYQPMYLAPLSNPAIYTPVCEQGMFPYIAYTTKAEEDAGVPRRFLLSLPLSISRRNVTLSEDPAPPTTSYNFTAFNLTEAQSAIRGAVFSGLLGKVFHVHVSHDGLRDWIVDLDIVGIGDSEHHFSECYRT